MADQYWLYADDYSAAILADASSKILLVGSDFGYGNFGDILQHRGAICFHKSVGKFRTVSLFVVGANNDPNFSSHARISRGADAAIFVSNVALEQGNAASSLKPLCLLRNLSALHLYGGGFLNESWGDFVLGVVEYFLSTSPIKSYVVSGQQVTKPYHERVVRHLEKYRPTCFGVRDQLSQDWLKEAGFAADFSFDDAVEELQSLHTKIPLAKAEGLFLHLNLSDYTGNGSENSGLVDYLQSISATTAAQQNVTVLQAYVDRRREVVDSREAIKELGNKFPFSSYRTLELPAAIFQQNSKPEPIVGAVGFSCSYHVALWLQLSGVPCWLPGSNQFYRQKADALQVYQDFASFLTEPRLADHKTKLEQHAQWQERLKAICLAAPEISSVWEPSSQQLSYIAPGTSEENVVQEISSVSNQVEQKASEQENDLQDETTHLRSQIRARDELITELGNLVHEYKQRAEAAISQSGGSSRFKQLLVRLWDALPSHIQRRIEPFADYVDRVVK